MSRILRYFLTEALTSMRRGLGISLLAAGTIGIALTILGLFLYFSGNLSIVVQRWSEDVQINVYLRDDITPEARRGLEARLQQQPEVDVMMFVPKDVALERFRREFAELGRLAELLDANPLPASFEVRMRPEHRAPDALERFARSLESAEGVEDVDYDTGWVRRLDALVNLVGAAATFFGVVLLVAATFTASNVIRLAMYSRRDEVEILQLVGATRGFIQGPFLLEGLLQGIAGGLLALTLLGATHGILTALVPSSGNVFLRVLSAGFLSPATATALVLGGGAMGLLGSLFAVRKFLTETDDIAGVGS